MADNLRERLTQLLMSCAADEGLDLGRAEDPEQMRLIGSVDSADLVALLVALEERIDDELGVEVSLMSDVAMSRSRSPFRTVATLAEFTESLVDAERSDG